jgi:hypothetical protein
VPARSGCRPPGAGGADRSEARPGARQIPLHAFDVSAAIAVGGGAVWIGGDLHGPIRVDPETGAQTSIPIKGPGGSRMTVTSLAVTGGRPIVTGELAAPVKAKGGHDYVASERHRLAFLGLRGRPLRLLPTPAAMGIMRGRDGSAWLSGWPAQDVFAVPRGIEAVRRVLRMATPGHLLAVRGDTIWVFRPKDFVVHTGEGAPPAGEGNAVTGPLEVSRT